MSFGNETEDLEEYERCICRGKVTVLQRRRNFHQIGAYEIETSETTQYGEGEEVVDTKIDGDDNEIALNSQFILDVLGSIGGDSIVFEIGEKTTPVIIKPKTDDGFLHIIMPLKI